MGGDQSEQLIRRRAVIGALGGAIAAAGAGAGAGTAGRPRGAAARGGQPGSDGWPTYMYGLGNRGYNPEATGLDGDVAARWTFDRDGGDDRQFSDPVVADGTVYAGAAELWALDAADGSVEWSFAGDAGGERFLAAAASGDAVYAGAATDDGGAVYALAADGTEQWRYGAGDGVSAVVPAGDVVLAAEDHADSGSEDRLVALEAATGEERWSFGYGSARGSNLRTPPAPAVADGTAYVKATQGVYALDVATGDVQWRREREDYHTAHATLAVADGTVYVSPQPAAHPEEASRLFALDAADGSVRWTFTTPPGAPTGEWSSPTVGEDVVYVSIRDRDGGRELYAVSRADGSLEWATRAYARGAALAGDVLYLGAAALAGDGSRLWTYDLDAPAAPAAVGESVYVADADRVVALESAAATDTGTATDADTHTPTDGDAPDATGTPTPTGTGTPTPAGTDTPTVTGTGTPTATGSPTGDATEGAGGGFGVLAAAGGLLGGLAYYLADLLRESEE